MSIKTFHAKTFQEALARVRDELGPDAAVLRTREIRGGGLLGWLARARQIEVTASDAVDVPSRLPARLRAPSTPPADAPPAHVELDYQSRFRAYLRGQSDDTPSMVEALCRPRRDAVGDHSVVLAELIQCGMDEALAREYLQRVGDPLSPDQHANSAQIKAAVAKLIESDLLCSGPICSRPGHRRVVALVGPTGVGKTTTIAKLAANFRLRERIRVGLVTVDTYRIAAVEQLRTYADIIDLPMRVVSTPREMRAAIEAMTDLDLVLVDTAGRSPRDALQISELKSLLAEARADEVHLVLSSVAGAGTLAATADCFAAAGTTNLIITKLDEAAGLGNLLPVLRSSRLPLTYLTHGQNVPDDIVVADRKRLARAMVGVQE